MGHLAAINQRNQQIAQQKEQAASMREQTAALEKQNKIEADRSKTEQRRLEIEERRERADIAEREMRRQQEEQLKQLRNLIADSDADLEQLEKKANTLDPDAFLRGMAALQANVQILDAESGALNDLSDMKALRQLKSQLAESIETHAQSGKLPTDPLRVIAGRLEKLDHFFAEVRSVAKGLLTFHKDWLNPNIPAVSKADLLAAQVELSALQTKLPQEIQRLGNLLDSADWTSTNGAADLHPEYLVCLESLNLPTLPRSAKIRLKRYQFVHGEGPLFIEVQQHSLELGQRIESLLVQHEEHRVQLEQVDAHNQAGNFRRAAKVLNLLGIIEDSSASITVNTKAKLFTDLSYRKAIENTQSLFQNLSEVQEILDLPDRVFQQRAKQDILSLHLAKIEDGLVKDSELERECLALMDAIRKRAGAMKKANRNQRISLAILAALIFLAVGVVMNLQAQAEKKRIIAEAIDQKARVDTEVAAKKERAKVAVAQEKARIEVEDAAEKARVEAETVKKRADDEAKAAKEKADMAGEDQYQSHLKALADKRLEFSAGHLRLLGMDEEKIRKLLINGGTVTAWGKNDDGQCNVPKDLRNVVSIATGSDHSLALKNDGRVIAWGSNYFAQCNVPENIHDVVAISASCYYSLALRNDGSVVAWGTGFHSENTVPEDLNIRDIVSISAGGEHNLALRRDGSVVAWGRNQVGRWHTGACDIPKNLHDVVAISAGGGHSLALKKGLFSRICG